MIKADLPALDYFADPAIGSSNAKLVLTSRQLYRDHQQGLTEAKSSPAQTFGTAFHARLLQPALFAELISPGPINPKTGNVYGYGTKAFDEWATANPGKLVLSEADQTTMELMLQRMPIPVGVIFNTPGQSELSVFTSALDVPIKARLDYLSDDTITDVKTIDDVDDIRHHMKSYKYWFQQEWYKRVMRAETGRKHKFQFVFAEKNPPYRWRIVTASEEVCEEGSALVEVVLIKLTDAIRTNVWADEGEVRQIITWPDCGYYEEVA